VSGLREGTQQRMERAARPWIEPFARLGLAARGAVYGVVGILAIRIAFERFEESDRKGALEAVARQPLGKVLLVAICAGFAGYALWRFTQAVLDTEDHGADAAGLVRRVGDLGASLLYGAFCLGGIRFLMGAGGHVGGDAEQQQTWTARVLSEPLGRWLVVAIGLIVITVGIVSGYSGLTGKYRTWLKNHEIDPKTNRWIDEVAVTGFLGRMASFGLVGIFLVKAAIDFDARESAGLDGALKRLGTNSWGDLLIVLVGIGLFAYGGLSFVESRYRRVLGS
jgi:uncharacterized protein DUF1206